MSAIEDDGELLDPDDDGDDDDDEPDDSKWYSYINFSYFKSLIALLIIFIAISSDVFIDKVLGRISGASEHRSPTSKGVGVQAMFLIISMVIIDMIIHLGYP